MDTDFNIKYYNNIKKILNIPFVLIKKEVHGLNNIPNKPYILAGNHKSMLDIPLIITSIDDDIHFMAKKELFQLKILSNVFKKMGAFPVDRDSVDIKAIKEALRILKNEEVLGIFPEGTRNKTDNVILTFKKGVTSIASKTNSLIVPFGISGEYKVGKKVILNIGEAIDIKNIDKENQNLYLEESVKKLILYKK